MNEKTLQFFIDLESLPLSYFVNESLWGYPALISLHALGMGIFVGISIVVHLRNIGLLPSLTLVSINRLLAIAWPALLINLLSGLCMFMAQASLFVTNTAFLTKLTSLLLAVLLTFLTTRPAIFVEAREAAEQSATAGRLVSVLAVVLFAVVIASGRLIAYTGDFA